jgi:hypothetical protein
MAYLLSGRRRNSMVEEGAREIGMIWKTDLWMSKTLRRECEFKGRIVDSSWREKC